MTDAMPQTKIAPGAIVRVDFPGHSLHGQRVRIDRIVPDFNIAHEDGDPLLCEMIFIMHPSLPGPVGIHRARLGGTVENASLRQWLEHMDAGGAQGELLL